MQISFRLFIESIRMALDALVVNKLRTFLSLLGITIGIFAIIAVFTAVDALESQVKSSVESLGNNVIYVQKWPWEFGSEYPWWKYWQRPVPSLRDLNELKERCQLSDAIAFMSFASDAVLKNKYASIEDCNVNMVSHEYGDIGILNYVSGRYFTESESKSGTPVCVIGADVKNDLFPNNDAVDQEISYKGHKMHVIGVLKYEGESIMGNSNDRSIFVPVNFARKFIDIKTERVNPMILVKARDNISNAQLIEEVRGHMRAIRRTRPGGDENFALNEVKLLSNQITNLFNVITITGWIIGGFSILVGGFGIANIMFVSVKERTPIIGIQKSLGAKRNFILFQYLTESVTLCVLGGLLGIFIVYLLTLIVSNFGFDMNLTLENCMLGIGVSVIIGIVSGLFPAYQAAKLDPVEAIRG